MKKNLHLSCLFILSFICINAEAYAASFQVNEQSAATLGRANAGTAVTDDASIQFFNPAGMTQMSGRVGSITGAFINPKINFKTLMSTDYEGERVKGNQTSPAVNALVPSLYYIQPIFSRFYAGIGVTVPYGLSSHYSDNSTARYFATQSKIQVININPSLAYKFNENFSIGAGVNAQRADAILNQAAIFSAPGEEPKDIFINNTAHSWGYGWNVGVLFQVPGSKVGLSYRSAVRHNLKGTTEILGIQKDEESQDFARFLGLVNGKVATQVTLPDSAILSMSHALTNRLTLLTDVQYTFWSKLQDVTLKFSGNSRNMKPSTLSFHYNDAWRVALGQEFKINEGIKLRSGVAYDQSPVNAEHTSARLPDSDRLWLSVGMSFRFAKQWLLDIGYARLLFQPTRIFQQNPTFEQSQFLANYKATANLFAIQLSVELDK